MPMRRIKKAILNRPFSCLIITLVLGLFIYYPKIDIEVSRFFYSYEAKLFYLKEHPLFKFIHSGFPEILVGIATAVLIIWLTGEAKGKQWIWGIDRKVGSYVVGSLALGPGIIVNGIFKSLWGRARPIQIAEFGGDKIFTPPMVITNQCNWNCSFMSGHASVGFWVTCFAFMVKGKARPYAIAAAIILGCVFSLSRIAQGGHFLSDVIYAGVVTILLNLWLYGVIFEKEN